MASISINEPTVHFYLYWNAFSSCPIEKKCQILTGPTQNSSRICLLSAAAVIYCLFLFIAFVELDFNWAVFAGLQLVNSVRNRLMIIEFSTPEPESCRPALQWLSVQTSACVCLYVNVYVCVFVWAVEGRASALQPTSLLCAKRLSGSLHLKKEREKNAHQERTPSFKDRPIFIYLPMNPPLSRSVVNTAGTSSRRWKKKGGVENPGFVLIFWFWSNRSSSEYWQQLYSSSLFFFSFFLCFCLDGHVDRPTTAALKAVLPWQKIIKKKKKKNQFVRN